MAGRLCFHPAARNACALALLLGFAVTGIALAEVAGTTHTATSRGLRVTADTTWMDGSGYLPVRFTVTPVRPLTVERTLDFSMTVHYRASDNARSKATIRRRIRVPIGGVGTTFTMPLPRRNGWEICEIKVRDREDRRFRIDIFGVYNWPWESCYEECLPKILVVADDLPETANLAGLFDALAIRPHDGTATAKAGTPIKLPTAMHLRQRELPAEWIAFSNFDIVCLSIEDLEQLASGRPASFQALLLWTAAGGNLLVSGAGQQWQRLAEVESVLGFPDPGDTKTESPKSRGWQTPSLALIGRPVEGVQHARTPFDRIPTLLETQREAEEFRDQRIYGFYSPQGESEEGETEPVPDSDFKPPARPQRASFAMRPIGGGTIVAMTHDQAFDFSSVEWAWLLDVLGRERYSSVGRYGLSTIRDNPDFGNFVVPGVGLAPVNAFLLLITLFVLAIGPVNYVLLRRWRRVHLLLVTIPAAAMVVTTGLLVYVLLSDGLHTRAMVRSVTHLDQRRGQAVCWSRLSYYAGLPPSDGLRFSTETVVIPLIPSPTNERGRTRSIQWGEDQHLADGWIVSRTPAQLVTTRARPSDRGLAIDAPASATAESITVQNRLGTKIHRLIVRTKAGGFFEATDVPPKATVEATRVDRATLSRMLPERIAETYGETIAWEDVSRSQYSWNSLDSMLSPATFLDEPLQADSVREQMLSDLRSLRPGSYAAIVEKSPEAEMGTPKAHVESALHVVLGAW